MHRLKKLVPVVVSFLSFFVLLGIPATVHAQTANCEPASSILGIPTWYAYLDGEILEGKCSPIITDSNSALPIGLAVLDIAIRVAGIVAVVMVVVGSYKFILSVGEPDAATSARKTVINSLIGLVIIIVSSSVVSFIGNRIGS